MSYVCTQDIAKHLQKHDKTETTNNTPKTSATTPEALKLSNNGATQNTNGQGGNKQNPPNNRQFVHWGPSMLLIARWAHGFWGLTTNWTKWQPNSHNCITKRKKMVHKQNTLITLTSYVWYEQVCFPSLLSFHVHTIRFKGMFAQSYTTEIAPNCSSQSAQR